MSSVTKNQLGYIFKSLGEFSRRKQWFNFKCPFHHGERQNFGIDVGAGVYRCLGCDSSGGLVGLYTKLRKGAGGVGTWGEGLLVPAEAAEALAGTSSPVREAVQTVVDHEGNSQAFYRKFTPLSRGESVSAVSARKYLTRREVDWFVWDVGLHEDLPGRVVFPFVEDGKVVYYMGRSFENIPLKTVNPDSAKGWLQKSDVLFNYQAVKCSTHVIICEGIFDAISAQTKSGLTATCLLGKTISEQQIRLLKRAGVSSVTVFLDSDARYDSVALAMKLYYTGFKVNLVDWGELVKGDFTVRGTWKDPGEIPEAPMKFLLQHATNINPDSELLLLAESL